MNTVVTELVIDGRGAEVGSAAYVRAMQIAQAAVDRLRDREEALKTASDANAASMISASTSTQRAAPAFDRLKASIDPAFAAAKGLERDILTLDRAVTRLGVTEQEAARLMDMVVLKHDAAAQAARRQTEEYLRLAAAGREAQQADRAQGAYNQNLGVRDPASFVGAARASAGTFSTELDRLDEISRQKAQQIGLNFARDLDSSLVAGTGKSARDAATVFSAELDQLDEIARLRALEAGSAFTAGLNARLGIGANAGSARDSAGVFAQQARETEDYGRQVAMVRAQIDPLSVAIEHLNNELAMYATMMQRGDLTTQQFAAAQRMAQARMDEFRMHAEAGRRSQALGGNMMSSINAAQQLQDIAITSAMGQSIPTIALQQGTQFGMAAMMTGGGGSAVGLLNSIKSSFATLANPIMLGSVAFTAVTAAAIQFFSTGREGAKDLTALLKEHNEALKASEDGYKKLDNVARGTGRPSQLVSGFQSQQAIEALRKGFSRDSALGTLDPQLLIARDLPGPFSSDPTAVKYMVQASDAALGLEDVLTRLMKGIEAGNAPVAKFNDELAAMGQAPGASKELKTRIAEILEITKALGEAQLAIQAYDRNFGPGGLLRGASEFNQKDMQALERFRMEENSRLTQMRRQYDADVGGIGAKSPDQLAAAARARESATFNMDETASVRRLRIENAATLERARAEQDLKDSQESRIRGYEQSLSQQREEIALIGKTASETASLQFQTSALQNLREEAARNGITTEEEFLKYFGKEIELIDEAAAKLKVYVELLGKARLRDDLGFDTRQLGRSELDQSVAGKLKQYGLSEDLDGQDAALVRSNELLKKQVELWKDIRKSGMDAYSDIFDLAIDGFDNWQDRLSDIAKDMAKNLYNMSIKNPFINERYPEANLPTLNQTGGIGGFFSTMLGLTPNPAAGAQSVGAMTVNAGSVIVTGSIGASGGDGLLKRIFSPANGNGGGLKSSDFAPMSLSGIGSPSGSAYGTDLASNIRSLASNIGAKPRELAALMSFESGLRSDVWGGAGKNYYGLIQAGESERSSYGINPGGSLADQFAGIERFFKGRGFKPGMSGLDLYSTVNAGSPGRYNASDAANGGTWGTVADKWNLQMGPHFAKADALLGSSNRAAQALDNLATKSVDLNGGFDLLGKGLMGQNGQGGILSFLGSANFKPNTTLSAYLGYGGQQQSGGGFLGGIFGILGKLFGLPGFAVGTDFAPGGLARINERGLGEIVDLPRGSRVIPHDVSMRMASQPTQVVNTIQVINNAGASIRQEQEDDGQGGRRTQLIIEERVGSAIARKGGAANKALASMGLARPMKVR